MIEALKNGREASFHPPEELFTDVYDKPTANLIEQQKELMEHLEKYGEHYKSH